MRAFVAYVRNGDMLTHADTLPELYKEIERMGYNVEDDELTIVESAP